MSELERPSPNARRAGGVLILSLGVAHLILGLSTGFGLVPLLVFVALHAVIGGGLLAGLRLSALGFLVALCGVVAGVAAVTAPGQLLGALAVAGIAALTALSFFLMLWRR